MVEKNNVGFNRAQKMLLGIAIGDAFGAGYEFGYKDVNKFREELDVTKYSKNPNRKLGHYDPGMYTDDTQMSIAVAELLVSGKEVSKNNFADYFVNCFKRDPIMGYAKGFQQFLEEIKDGVEFLERIRPTSERNGAAMRAVPLGIIKDRDKVIEYATINAQVTHDNPKGIASSVGVALLSHSRFHLDQKLEKEYFFNEIKKIDLETHDHLRAIDEMGDKDNLLLNGLKYERWGIPCDGMRTLGAVTYLLSRYDEPLDVLKEAICLGGDTDSVASIALGITMVNKKMSDLPDFLYDGLTNHKYGKEYLLDLGDRVDHFMDSR